MAIKMLIPAGIELALPARPEVVYVRYAPAESIPIEHEDAEVLVVWGMPGTLVREAASRLHGLRWVQTLSAGTEVAVQAGFGEDVVITSGSSLHDRPVAEHALSLVLAAARRLHTMVRAQIGHRWAAELGGPQVEPSPGLFSTLRGARVVIWGFGNIATTLAPHLVALGASVTGAASRARVQDGFRVLDVDELWSELPVTDVLIMILPSTPSTQEILSRDRLARLPRHAWVVNVGRGTTVDEAALVDALREGRLGGAALDVVAEEPLAVGSALWDLPNVIITPHAACGRPIGAEQLVSDNLAAYVEGRELANVVRR